MKQILFLITLSLLTLISCAARVSGLITDHEGKILPYASIQVKGGSKGTTANSEGKYFISLEAGIYTIVCQHVGYKREEKSVTVGNADINIDFKLEVQQLVLSEVVIKKGEDPAYEIIRKTIKKRTYYQHQVNAFQCEVYTKGLLKLRDFPTGIR